MMFKYSKVALDKMQKIRSYSKHGQNESAGPIFGCILGPDNDNDIFIHDLFNKTSYSSHASAGFFFKKYPRSIKKFNKKQRKINGRELRYIGTWHTHPSFELEPSHTDLETMDLIFGELSIYKNVFIILNDEGILTMEKTKNKLKKEVYKWKS